MFRIQQS